MNNNIYRIREYKGNINIEKLFMYFKSKDNFIFLDSSLINTRIGRYSILVYEPFYEYKSWGNSKDDSLNKIKEVLKKYRNYFFDKRVPFISGAVGYLSYELANEIEVLPAKKDNIINMPDIHFGFYNHAIIIDNISKKTYITASTVGMQNKRVSILNEKINKIIREIEIIGDIPPLKIHENANNITLSSNFSKEEYIEKVKIAKEYIRNGDIYQVNFSQRFFCKINKKPWEIYINLRIKNRAPFCVYSNLGGIYILSSSPERFIKITEDNIETRPIKGTRKRGENKEEDKKLRNDLLSSEKERAELTMIIDLERNDLGRICKIGSVNVEKMYYLENYESVIHMVSKIVGKINKGNDTIDVIKATFPGGSITGAPKIRSMEIINELENCSRNIYTGSIGYIDFNGNSDFNIAIRTIIMQDNNVIFNVGGAIVADSIPVSEYEETLQKGSAIINTLKDL